MRRGSRARAGRRAPSSCTRSRIVLDRRATAPSAVDARGASRRRRSISSSIVAVSSPSDSALGSSGAKRGSVGRRRARACMRAGHLAEPPGASRQPRRVVGASASSASSQPSADGGHERLHDAERRLERAAPVLERSPRAGERSRSRARRGSAAARARGSGRPRAGGRPSARALVEHDRAVRLLDADRPHRRAGGVATPAERRQRAATRPACSRASSGLPSSSPSASR